MRLYLFILLGLGMAAFILFLSTANGNRWMWRYAFCLRTNNNTRAGLCWIITGTFFISLLLVCAEESRWPVGLDVSKPHYSEITQEVFKLYEREMAGSPTVGDTVAHDVSTAVSKTLHVVHDAICSFLGYTLLFLSIFSAIYTIVALRDEFMGAVEDAKDKVFGGRSGEQNLPDVKPQAPATQTQQPSMPNVSTNGAGQQLRLRDYFKYEFIFALVSELINIFIHRRML